MSIKEKKILEKSLGKNVSVSAIFILILLAFSLSWFADGIAGVLPVFFPKENVPTIMLVISILVFIWFYIRIKQLSKKYAQEDDIDIKQQKSTPKKALVLTLSKYYKVENIENVKSIKSIKMTHLGCSKRDSNLGSWQMPLEAILYHLGRLESLVVITSKESDEQYTIFIALVDRLIDKKLDISKVCIDINNLDDIKEGYHEVTDLVSNYSDKEIVYDITSGTSLSTMAGSYFTLNADRLIQYVDTNSYTVKMYNNSYITDE